MKKRLFKLLSLAMAAVILLSVALPTVSATSGNIDPDIIAETSQTAVSYTHHAADDTASV